MTIAMDPRPATAIAEDVLLVRTPLAAVGIGAAYAAVLSLLERRYPIKPDHTWAEVAGGVLLTLMPVALEARKQPRLEWRTYENAIWRSFIASGTPVVLWQIGESIFRHIELLKYTANRETRTIDDAYTTSTLARGSRSGTRSGVALSDGSDPAFADGAGDA
jgi:hypothetical protein